MTAKAAPALTAFSCAPCSRRRSPDSGFQRTAELHRRPGKGDRCARHEAGSRQSAPIRGQMGGVEDFLREYGLSTREGLALMVLAEALLRVPDALTQDRLIEDKLKEGGWSDHETHGDTWFVSASAWALGMSARVVKPGETPEGVMRGLVKRMGMPTVRTATRQAMRFLGHHFVLGETIGEALNRAAKNEARGFRHSYDMLGEGARTRADAIRYFKSYADAIAAIGKSARQGLRRAQAAGPPRHLGQAVGAAPALSRNPPRTGACGTGAGPGQACPDGQGA